MDRECIKFGHGQEPLPQSTFAAAVFSKLAVRRIVRPIHSRVEAIGESYEGDSLKAIQGEPPQLLP